MNPYTYQRRDAAPQVHTLAQASRNALACVRAVIGAQVSTAIAIAMVVFAAGSVVSVASVAMVEGSSADYMPVAAAQVIPGRVLGEVTIQMLQSETSHPTATLFQSRYLTLKATPVEYSAAAGKWNYKITWDRAAGRTGSIYINGNPFVGTASGKGEQYTGFHLNPSSRYRVVFYSKPDGKGLRVANRWMNVLAPGEDDEQEDGGDDAVFCPMDVKQCPDGSYVSRVSPSCQFAACPTTQPKPQTYTNTSYQHPSYGYRTVSAGDVVSGSWREGWVEIVSGINASSVRVSGWAYDEGKAINIRAAVKNMDTGVIYYANGANYQPYREDVKNYLAQRLGRQPAAVNGMFSVDFNNLPAGRYVPSLVAYGDQVIPMNVTGTAQYGMHLYNYASRDTNPAYGYALPGNGSSYSYTEGWVEQFSPTADGQISIRGWAYDNDKTLTANINLYNETTMAHVTVHQAVTEHRSDVATKLSDKFRIGGITVPTGFFLKTSGLPKGSYRIVGATFTRADGSNNANFYIHGQSQASVIVP